VEKWSGGVIGETEETLATEANEETLAS